MKTIFKTACVIAFFLLVYSQKSFAQRMPTVNTPGSDNNNPNAHPPHTTGAPFDPTLAILVLAGASYGVYRAVRQKKLVSGSK
jgi:hypothetical protein